MRRPHRLPGYDQSSGTLVYRRGKVFEQWTMPNGGTARRYPDHAAQAVQAWHEEQARRLREAE